MSEDPKQPDVATLQAEITKLKDRAQTFEAKTVDYEKRFGWIKDPEKVKADLEAFDLLQREKAGGDPKEIQAIVDREVGKVKDSFSSKLTEYETKLGSTSKELKTLRVTNVAMQEAAKHFNADGLPLLQKEIDANTDFVDGKVVIIKDGKARDSEKDPRKPMELPEYMEILARQYPSLAKSQAVGGNKPEGKTYGNGGTRLTIDEYKRLDKNAKDAYFKALPEPERRALFQNLFSN